MIEVNEILNLAGRLSLNPRVIEKDYVIGWILAGIYNHDLLKNDWIFKGGTCIKKCFFDTNRMSEDLDFTLKNSNHLNSDFLHTVFNEVNEWIYNQCGLNTAADTRYKPIYVDIYKNPRNKPSCEARMYYRGPISNQYAAPMVKLDLTADEKLVLPPIKATIEHTYSDTDPNLFYANAYSFEEIFSEKIRALGERTRPGARDLYDVINLFHRNVIKDPITLRNVLTEKCNFKGIGLITLNAIQANKEQFLQQWHQQLSHQIAKLPDFDSYWDVLPDFFAWLYK